MNFIYRHWFGITAASLLAITIGSLSPISSLPEVPGTDKTHHLVAYAVLMLPVALRQTRYWLWIGLLFVVWSGVIELIQPLVNRYGEWLDLAANTAGLSIGVLLGFILRRFLSKPG